MRFNSSAMRLGLLSGWCSTNGQWRICSFYLLLCYNSWRHEDERIQWRRQELAGMGVCGAWGYDEVAVWSGCTLHSSVLNESRDLRGGRGGVYTLLLFDLDIQTHGRGCCFDHLLRACHCETLLLTWFSPRVARRLQDPPVRRPPTSFEAAARYRRRKASRCTVSRAAGFELGLQQQRLL